MTHNMIFLLKKVQATKIKTGLFKRNAIYKKSNRERQRLYDLAYTWKLKNSDRTKAKLKTNQTKKLTDHREQTWLLPEVTGWVGHGLRGSKV